jgi:hypothetical protein
MKQILILITLFAGIAWGMDEEGGLGIVAYHCEGRFRETSYRIALTIAASHGLGIMSLAAFAQDEDGSHWEEHWPKPFAALLYPREPKGYRVPFNTDQENHGTWVWIDYGKLTEHMLDEVKEIEVAQKIEDPTAPRFRAFCRHIKSGK